MIRMLIWYLLPFFLPIVSGHGFLKSPQSRNYIARLAPDLEEWTPNGLNAGGPTYCASRNPLGGWPAVETVDTSVRRGLCGEPAGESQNYLEPPAGSGNLLTDIVGGAYPVGAAILFEWEITAHHRGHFEVKVCDRASFGLDRSSAPTQECFSAKSLERVPDTTFPDSVDISPIDPNYPDRYYLPPACALTKENTLMGGYHVRTGYQLPADLTCDNGCVVQWRYVTANSCNPPGYTSRTNWPSDDCDSWWQSGLLPCGDILPEEFWNCADIDIELDPSINRTKAPTPSPMTLSPTVDTNTRIPTASPTESSQLEDATVNSSKRVVAYVENWMPCPTDAQVEHYTHIVISFAVSYTWAESKNQCSETCTIGAPLPICNNANNQALVDKWRAAGKQVLVGFGGAGMGGSWDGDVNDCWEHCFDKSDYVVSQLVGIVNTQNMDGIDIDYEYHLSNPVALDFLENVTVKLRQQLPPDSVITHAPMDSDVLDNSKPYFQLLQRPAMVDSVSFIMPQYYNGPYRPGIDLAPALANFITLADEIYSGDASRVVFGFCIADCSGTGSNVDASRALEIVVVLQDQVPNFGGIFFWSSPDDGPSGAWSGPIRSFLDSITTTISPTLYPSFSPTSSLSTFAPTVTPTGDIFATTLSPTVEPTDESAFAWNRDSFNQLDTTHFYQRKRRGVIIADTPDISLCAPPVDNHVKIKSGSLRQKGNAINGVATIFLNLPRNVPMAAINVTLKLTKRSFEGPETYSITQNIFLDSLHQKLLSGPPRETLAGRLRRRQEVKVAYQFDLDATYTASNTDREFTVRDGQLYSVEISVFEFDVTDSSSASSSTTTVIASECIVYNAKRYNESTTR